MRTGDSQSYRYAAGFFNPDVIPSVMETVRKGLRDGDIEKDTYERLTCAECEQNLATRNDPEEIGSVRACPECGTEWKELR